jgi:uncharacterized protein (TIGR03437 family)
MGIALRPVAAGPLSDTAVLVNDISAPLLYASTTQIGVIIPYGVAGQSSATVTVTYQNSMLVATTVPVALAAPGIFSVDFSGVNQGVIFNQSGVQNSSDHPAELGSTIGIIATGAGQMTPALADGQIVSSTSPLPVPILKVSVYIGGVTAQVSSAGAVPNLIAGLIEVYCQIPSHVTPGSAVPVVLQIGDGSSQAGLMMAIK